MINYYILIMTFLKENFTYSIPELLIFFCALRSDNLYFTVSQKHFLSNLILVFHPRNGMKDRQMNVTQDHVDILYLNQTINRTVDGTLNV